LNQNTFVYSKNIYKNVDKAFIDEIDRLKKLNTYIGDNSAK